MQPGSLNWHILGIGNSERAGAAGAAPPGATGACNQQVGDTATHVEERIMQIQFISRQIAGPVWIGDPCYIWPKSARAAFRTAYEGTDGNDRAGIIGSVDGLPMFIWRTAFGDGHYPVYHQHPQYGAIQNVEIGTCPVDSGLLCIVPVEALRRLHPDNPGIIIEVGINYGVVLDATAIPEANGEGNVQFGPYRIVPGDQRR